MTPICKSKLQPYLVLTIENSELSVKKYAQINIINQEKYILWHLKV